MRYSSLFVISIIILSLGILDSEAKTTKFQESLRCQPTSDCSSTFTIPEGVKAALTISVASSDRINFKVEDPNGGDVRLRTSGFPDTSGFNQVFNREFTAEMTGDHTLYFQKPIPANFDATVTVVISDSELVPVRDIPAAGTPNFEGGCLIATATYGSELAPQVQTLREIRDNSLLQTESGTAFMNSFNEFYYSFSPIVADYERENPVFKELVRIGITPMISSLSILNHVEMHSEITVIGFGISLILLNAGMYIVVPAAIIIKIKNKV